MKYTIQHRRGTTAQWNAANPVLAFGEVGVEDTGAGLRSKIGDGTTVWAILPYADDTALAAALSAEANAVSHADAGDVAALAASRAYTDGKTAGLAALLADTGWRNIYGYVPTAIAGKLVARRVGSVIEIAGEGLQLSGTPGTADFMSPLGAGWRPNRPIYTKATDYWSDSIPAVIRVWTDAKLRGQFGSTANPIVHFQIVYTTTDTWPATLPGTPA